MKPDEIAVRILRIILCAKLCRNSSLGELRTAHHDRVVALDYCFIVNNNAYCNNDLSAPVHIPKKYPKNVYVCGTRTKNYIKV